MQRKYDIKAGKLWLEHPTSLGGGATWLDSRHTTVKHSSSGTIENVLKEDGIFSLHITIWLQVEIRLGFLAFYNIFTKIDKFQDNIYKNVSAFQLVYKKNLFNIPIALFYLFWI